ncbi:MAG: hypothetical protein RMI78_03895 [Nitrososphaerota archaeon]|nr:hypothetical protein [Nitrososphaerota archaeon]
MPRRRGVEEIPQPLTHLKCLECGTVNSRPFTGGDYVFKEVEERCPKCGASKMKIIGIYVEEERKTP